MVQRFVVVVYDEVGGGGCQEHGPERGLEHFDHDELLSDGAVDLDAEDEWVVGALEGVRPNRVNHPAKWYLGGERVAVEYHRFVVGPVPYIHCIKEKKFLKKKKIKIF